MSTYITDKDHPFSIVTFIPVEPKPDIPLLGSWLPEGIIQTRERKVMVAATDALVYEGKPTFDDSIEQVLVHKEVSGVGTNNFVINLVARTDEKGLTWDKKIIPNDLVVIQMIRPKEDKIMKTMMVGLVQEVLRNTEVKGTPEKPVVRRSVTIKGFDVSGIFTHHTIFNAANYLVSYGELPDDIKKITAVHLGIFLAEREEEAISGRTVNDMIKYVLDEYLSESLSSARIGSLSDLPIFDLIDYSNLNNDKTFKEREGEPLKIFGFDYLSLSGPSFAEFMLQLLQIPFNEIVTRYEDFSVSLLENRINMITEDIITANNIPKMRFVVRASPFKFDPGVPYNRLYEDGGSVDERKEDEHGFEIQTHHIDDEDVVSETIGRTNHRTYNMFLTAPRSQMAIGMHPALNVHPAYDREKIKRYGFKFNITPLDYFNIGPTREFQSRGVTGTEASYGAYGADLLIPAITTASYLSNVLKQWFIRENEFIKGEITIKGIASIREGDFLEYKSKEMGLTLKAYIEAVDHVFVNFDSYTTSLTISRGTVEDLA